VDYIIYECPHIVGGDRRTGFICYNIISRKVDSFSLGFDGWLDTGILPDGWKLKAAALLSIMRLLPTVCPHICPSYFVKLFPHF
jgi:hypothetical protein